MKNKKILLSILSLATLVSMASCSSSNNEQNSQSVEDVTSTSQEVEKTGEKYELSVFAAASMTEILDKIKVAYEKENPDVNLVFNFDSSGTLKTQIDQGAEADVFISAAQKQMDELQEEGDKIDESTRFDLLENEVTLVVAENNPKGIEIFKDLENDSVEKIAFGNEDVPVGQYSEEILKNLGIWEKIQDKITFGSNVKEVTSWVSEGVVDAGIVYKTDAKAAGLEIVASADDSMLENKVIYPAAVLENSSNKDEAVEFLNFLQTDTVSKILEEAGFTPLSK